MGQTTNSKIHKNALKMCYLFKASWEFEFLYKLYQYLAQNLTLFGYSSPDFTFPDEQISNRVHIVNT